MADFDLGSILGNQGSYLPGPTTTGSTGTNGISTGNRDVQQSTQQGQVYNGPWSQFQNTAIQGATGQIATGAQGTEAPPGMMPALGTLQGLQGQAQASQGYAQGIAGYAAPSTATNTSIQGLQQGVQAQQVGTTMMSGAALQPYIDPYTNQVVDTTLASYDHDARVKQAQLEANLGLSRSFGSRGDVARSLQASDTQRNRALQESQLRDAAYKGAVSAFQTDQSRALDASKANQTAALTAAQLTQSGLTSAGQLSQADLTRQQGALVSAAGVSQAGTKLQGDLATAAANVGKGISEAEVAQQNANTASTKVGLDLLNSGTKTTTTNQSTRDNSVAQSVSSGSTSSTGQIPNPGTGTPGTGGGTGAGTGAGGTAEAPSRPSTVPSDATWDAATKSWKTKDGQAETDGTSWWSSLLPMGSDGKPQKFGSVSLLNEALKKLGFSGTGGNTGTGSNPGAGSGYTTGGVKYDPTKPEGEQYSAVDPVTGAPVLDKDGKPIYFPNGEAATNYNVGLPQGAKQDPAGGNGGTDMIGPDGTKYVKNPATGKYEPVPGTGTGTTPGTGQPGTGQPGAGGLPAGVPEGSKPSADGKTFTAPDGSVYDLNGKMTADKFGTPLREDGTPLMTPPGMPPGVTYDKATGQWKSKDGKRIFDATGKELTYAESSLPVPTPYLPAGAVQGSNPMGNESLRPQVSESFGYQLGADGAPLTSFNTPGAPSLNYAVTAVADFLGGAYSGGLSGTIKAGDGVKGSYVVTPGPNGPTIKVTERGGHSYTFYPDGTVTTSVPGSGMPNSGVVSAMLAAANGIAAAQPQGRASGGYVAPPRSLGGTGARRAGYASGGLVANGRRLPAFASGGFGFIPGQEGLDGLFTASAPKGTMRPDGTVGMEDPTAGLGPELGPSIARTAAAVGYAPDPWMTAGENQKQSKLTLEDIQDAMGRNIIAGGKAAGEGLDALREQLKAEGLGFQFDRNSAITDAYGGRAFSDAEGANKMVFARYLANFKENPWARAAGQAIVDQYGANLDLASKRFTADKFNREDKRAVAQRISEDGTRLAAAGKAVLGSWGGAAIDPKDQADVDKKRAEIEQLENGQDAFLVNSPGVRIKDNGAALQEDRALGIQLGRFSPQLRQAQALVERVGDSTLQNNKFLNATLGNAASVVNALAGTNIANQEEFANLKQLLTQVSAFINPYKGQGAVTNEEREQIRAALTGDGATVGTVLQALETAQGVINRTAYLGREWEKTTKGADGKAKKPRELDDYATWALSRQTQGAAMAGSKPDNPLNLADLKAAYRGQLGDGATDEAVDQAIQAKRAELGAAIAAGDSAAAYEADMLFGKGTWKKLAKSATGKPAPAAADPAPVAASAKDGEAPKGNDAPKGTVVAPPKTRSWMGQAFDGLGYLASGGPTRDLTGLSLPQALGAGLSFPAEMQRGLAPESLDTLARRLGFNRPGAYPPAGPVPRFDPKGF